MTYKWASERLRIIKETATEGTKSLRDSYR